LLFHSMHVYALSVFIFQSWLFSKIYLFIKVFPTESSWYENFYFCLWDYGEMTVRLLILNKPMNIAIVQCTYIQPVHALLTGCYHFVFLLNSCIMYESQSIYFLVSLFNHSITHEEVETILNSDYFQETSPGSYLYNSENKTEAESSEYLPLLGMHKMTCSFLFW